MSEAVNSFNDETLVFREGMTLRERFREYARHCLDGGYRLDTEEARTEVRRLFDAIEGGRLGAVVYGNPGSGKTILLQMIARCIAPGDPHRLRFRTCQDVVEDFNIRGHESLRVDRDRCVVFDDLGAETRGAHYGEKVEVMTLVIIERYKLWRDLGLQTYYTTNLKQEEIAQRYDPDVNVSRVMGRLRESCAQVKVDDGDKRKLKTFRRLFPTQHPRPAEEAEYIRAYEERRRLIAAAPQPPREGVGERMRRELWGDFGRMAGSTRPPDDIQKTTKPKRPRKK